MHILKLLLHLIILEKLRLDYKGTNQEPSIYLRYTNSLTNNLSRLIFCKFNNLSFLIKTKNYFHQCIVLGIGLNHSCLLKSISQNLCNGMFAFTKNLFPRKSVTIEK